MIKAKRKGTVARGAVIERALIQRWIARQLKVDYTVAPNYLSEREEDGAQWAWKKLGLWLKRQPSRTKCPGGIGR